jgi:hypothetical protein
MGGYPRNMRIARRETATAVGSGPAGVYRERGSRFGGVRRGAWRLARLVTLVAGLVALTLVVGILLVVLEANRDNAVVDAALDAARFLAGPFDDMFQPDGRELRVAVNWGLAAVIYLVAGGLIARLLRR